MVEEHPCVELILRGTGRYRHLEAYKNGLFVGRALEPALADDARALPLLKESHREEGAGLPLVMVGAPLAWAGLLLTALEIAPRPVGPSLLGAGAVQLAAGALLLWHASRVRHRAVDQFNQRAEAVGCR